MTPNNRSKIKAGSRLAWRCRLHVVSLEDRLPPGDVLGWSLPGAGGLLLRGALPSDAGPAAALESSSARPVMPVIRAAVSVAEAARDRPAARSTRGPVAPSGDVARGAGAFTGDPLFRGVDSLGDAWDQELSVGSWPALAEPVASSTRPPGNVATPTAAVRDSGAVSGDVPAASPSRAERAREPVNATVGTGTPPGLGAPSGSLTLLNFLPANFAGSDPAASPGAAISLSLTGSSRSLSSRGGFIGYNGANLNTSATNWTNSQFVSAVENIDPLTFRYPAGGIANNWDWQDGIDVTTPSVPPNTLDNLAIGLNAVKQNAGVMIEPIFVVNMLTPYTTRSGQTISAGDLLNNAVNELKYAQSKGLPVNDIELGNEFYFPAFANVFPTAQSYFDTAATWVRTLTQSQNFPNAKIAVVAYGGIGGDTRRTTWNDFLQQNGTPATNVTLHIYNNSCVDSTGRTTIRDSDATRLLGTAFARYQNVVANDVPNLAGKDVWVTEYNVPDPALPVAGSWMHGLYNATMALQLLQPFPNHTQVDFVDLHTLVESALYGGFFKDNQGYNWDPSFQRQPNPNTPTNPFAPTAAGRALSLLAEAAHSAVSARPIAFSSDPTLTAAGTSRGSVCGAVTYPSLVGWQFTNSAGTHQLALLNLSPNAVTVQLNTGANSNTYDQYSDGTPADYLTGFNRDTPNFKIIQGGSVNTTSQLVTLNGYSVTRTYFV